jgi:hypothetical protein
MNAQTSEELYLNGLKEYRNEEIAKCQHLNMRYSMGLLNSSKYIECLLESAIDLREKLQSLGLDAKQCRSPYGRVLFEFQSEEVYLAFCKDWKHFHEGVPLVEKHETPWLITLSDGKGTSAKVRQEVLSWMDGIYYPIELLKPYPLPERITFPGLRVLHTYAFSSDVCVTSLIAQGSILPNFENELGKRLQLLLENGSEAELVILSVEDTSGSDKKFQCKGFLRGYMDDSFDRDIALYVRGKEMHFYFSLSRYSHHLGNRKPEDVGEISDYEIFSNHPLWMKYREWQENDTRLSEYRLRMTGMEDE